MAFQEDLAYLVQMEDPGLPDYLDIRAILVKEVLMVLLVYLGQWEKLALLEYLVKWADPDRKALLESMELLD